jgi:hypothetical protein
MLAVLLCVAVSAQTHKPFPGDTADQRTLRLQERVEELYKAGDFRRALLIYENDLAPTGDKYAQYMVGYMHLNGQGTTADRAEAMAWYRLASERDDSVLDKARDELAVAMSPADLTASNQIFVELWKTIGDSRLIMELIQSDMSILRARTGSRIPGSIATSPSLIYRPTGELVGPGYYREVRIRLQARLNYLETEVTVIDIAMDSDNEDLRMLEQQIKEELAALSQP